ncbi:prolyl oligopeptidase family serine peptidase [Rhodanobacter sp. DHG33]|uniref:prolyl oligopeptidase family serine peptidase n=1 Tax=Rhodanobacter sp. DHG33 TaxID=2775921 RepID=UPI00177E7C12|nr:prolyl oligopeptidase family serine peptidase [Rhodanobacter sp. DHG33]MBD8897348.1 S9 family peptidase [Rhodanobacter sp. DHG33]
MTSKTSLWLALALGITVGGAGVAQAAEQTADDPYLWLEATHDARAMDWVKAQNAITEKAFASSADFDHTRDQILEVLDSDARIPYTSRMGDYLYNFWQDKAHPRGLWRRTTLDEYRKSDPQWETLLDVDALNKAEGKRWVFKDVDCLKPSYTRCLISLSPDGGDAVTVREFDTTTKSFVKGGFELPIAKTQTSWIDQDHIYISTDFGPGSMTKSSYPRITKEWTRGTPLASATMVYEGKADDLAISAFRDLTPGFERDFVRVANDFFHTETFLRKDGKLVKLDVPSDASADAHREWLLVTLRSPWTVGGVTYPNGALIATKFDDFMAGKRAFTVLFKPDAHTALSGYAWTQHHLILDELHDVQSRLEVLTPPANSATAGDWQREAMPGAPAMSTVAVVDTDPDRSDEYWLTVTGFLTPPSLERGVLGQGEAVTIKHQPAFFDASKFNVSQHFVTSKDGTRVPYFEIAPKDMKLDGSNRTLLYGYGGFEVSLQPFYSGSVGRAWLDRGGVYVIANIRGGGEYGPAWHQAALQANRPKAYQDFAAVAEDLVKRGVTSAQHLGAEGGSNGGLLMGNMLTQYPQLFGAIACEVPLLDMKRYVHLDAGASWIAEYGNPDDPKQWSFIKTFSPYQNVHKETHYPPVLFYTTTSDDRVGPAQARKMAAKMEGMGIPNVWFYENLEGGHGAGADNKQSAHMHAMVYDFLWDKLQ